MKVIVVSRDLMFASRIAAIAAEAGFQDQRVDEPSSVVAGLDDIIVLEWDDRTPQWATAVGRWAAESVERHGGPQVIAAVSHRDRDGIRAARTAGIEHVVARSGLSALLRTLLGVPHRSPAMG